MDDTRRISTLHGLAVFLVATVLLGLCAQAVEAKVYKYVDRTGELHYTDSIGQVPAEYRNQIEDITDDLARMDGFRVIEPAGGAAPPPADDGDTGMEMPDFGFGDTSDLDTDGGEAVAGIMESLGFGVILLAILAIPVLWIVSGLVLKLACRISGEDPPGLGRACGILFAQGLVGSAVAAAVAGVGMAMGIDESAGLASSLAVSGASSMLGWMANAGVLVSMMSYGFGKSMWIGFLHTLLVVVMIGGPIGGLVLIGVLLA